MTTADEVAVADLVVMTRTECTEVTAEEDMTITVECTEEVVRTVIRRRCIRGNHNRPAICKLSRA